MSIAICRCPGCGTSFRVTESQLRIADGSVRCGACLIVFTAEAYFVAPPIDVTERIAIHEEYWRDFELFVEAVCDPIPVREKQEAEPAVVTSEVAHWAPDNTAQANYYNAVRRLTQITEPKPTTGTPSAPEQLQEPITELNESSAEWVDSEEKAKSIALPDFDMQVDPELLLHDRRSFVLTDGIKWLPGITGLLLIGALQVSWYRVETFSQDEKYRDWYLSACEWLGCSVPDYDDSGQLMTRNLVVRSHPQENQGLLVDVLLRNNAGYKQRFPSLKLSFSDIDGALVADRIFTVNEYLGGEMRGLKYIPAQTEVRLSFELVDPGTKALGYEMRVVR